LLADRDAGGHASLVLGQHTRPVADIQVDEEQSWFNAAGSAGWFQRAWTGRSLPDEITALSSELYRALTETSPAEAGVSSDRWLDAWKFTHCAADAIRGSAAIQETEDALMMVRRAFKRPNPGRTSVPDGKDVEVLLRSAKVSKPPAGSGTLDTELVVLLSGEHNGRLELIDAMARWIGYAVPVNGFVGEDATTVADGMC
jgi:hypothetical protein